MTTEKEIRNPIAYTRSLIRPYVPRWAENDAAAHVVEYVLSHGLPLNKHTLWENRKRAWWEWKRMQSPVTGSLTPGTLGEWGRVYFEGDPLPAEEQENQEEPEEHPELHAAISSLPPQQKRAITLVYLECLTPAEAAPIMGVTSRVDVQNHLRRARKNLKKKLERSEA